jgi:hypothetical protein
MAATAYGRSGQARMAFGDSEKPVDSLFLVPAGGVALEGKTRQWTRQSHCEASRCAALLGYPAIWLTVLWYRRSRCAILFDFGLDRTLGDLWAPVRPLSPLGT